MDNMSAVKGKISYTDENGNEGYLGFEMPKCVLTQLELMALQWKQCCHFSFEEHEAYLKSLEKLNSKT